MKKTLSIILAVIMAFTGLTCAVSATDDEKKSTKEMSAQITSAVSTAVADAMDGEETDPPTDDEAEPIDGEEDVAEPEEEEPKDWKDYEQPVKMYFCASANSLSGHVWLYFVNLTDCDIPLGYATLKAGDEMSVGSLSYTRRDGGGTYYNGERMMATLSDIDNVNKHAYSMSTLLSPEQVEKVSEKIRRKNSYDLIFNNCGMFASTIWNSVSNKKVIHITLPITSIICILANGGKKNDLKMKPVAIEEVFRQTKDGYKQARIESFKTSSI